MSALITNKHTCYKALAKENKTLKHKTVRSTDHVNPKDKTVHLQHVNNTHKQLRDFLRPFNGVSSKVPSELPQLVCLRKRPGQIQNLA
ncbi:MAG: hypothetical protein U5L96_11780 [Owenweeksia sp.]|nr:hypothetical protein [Owenweeksia sp.]